MDYQNLFKSCPIELNKVLEAHTLKQQWVNQNKKGFLRYRTPYQNLSDFQAEDIDCTGDIVTIGTEKQLCGKDNALVKDNLKQFMPWRKGPFSVFGTHIDAEWRSERKWQRLENHLPDLAGKTIADIGCNNGYYMFRMTPEKPKFVLGFEPSVQHYYCFKALNSMAGFSNLDIDLLGVEHLSLFPECFDVIFLMGIIYHRSSPMDVLKDILTALKPGGTLILESQAIPGESPVALFPDKTYAKVPGTYFVPTGKCVENWMTRAGYEDVHLFNSHPMSSEEQRKTDWMTFESYEDFVQPDNHDLTIEGYPAPVRILISGKKKT